MVAVSPTSAVYGSVDGEVGLIDRRNNKCQWKNTVCHRDRIYDVCRMGQKIVTVDASGNIVSWAANASNLNNAGVMVAE